MCHVPTNSSTVLELAADFLSILSIEFIHVWKSSLILQYGSDRLRHPSGRGHFIAARSKEKLNHIIELGCINRADLKTIDKKIH
jgi:hypothetical protein